LIQDRFGPASNLVHRGQFQQGVAGPFVKINTMF
jgi:hypothetical protein